MRNQVFKKLFSVLLALIMVAGLLPASAMAGGWGAMDVDTTPVPTETVQPTESAEPTTPTETETPEVTEVPEPTPENPATTDESTQGEPTAEPTDEGIMPANVMPVQANVAARDTSGDDYYRIVHLDCGRKYFDVSYIKGIIDTMYLNGYNQLQLAFGNGGLRFVLDGMPQDLKDAIAQGNEKFYDSTTNELTQAEMTEIILYAKGKNIEIVPLLNMPGHMDGILSSDKYSGYKLSGSEGSLDLNNENAVAFGKELLSMYVEYFKTQGCKFFNFGADEYGQGIRNPYIESSVAQVNYKQLIDYMNACAEIIENAGMTARCFNDFVCYNNRTSCDLKKSVQVCYWSNQWTNSQYNTASVIKNAGYKLINTNQKWYFVPSKANEYSKATVLANFKTFDVTKFQYITNGEYNPTSTTYITINDSSNVGAMFCVWCDEPSVAVDLSDVKELIAAMADANPTYFTKVTIPNTTVGNATTPDNDTVRVTGPNLAALTATEYTEEIAGIKAVDGRIMAYDVTPSTADNNKYTGEAEVRIKIPAEWDSSKVNAFIVENDGTVNDITGKTEDGWYVFTAPHFSVMGIYEKAATTEVGGTIEIVAGSTGVITVPGDVTNSVGEIADETVAKKVEVKSVQQTGKPISYSATASASISAYTEPKWPYTSYSESNLIDGNANTYYWSKNPQTVGAYAQVDLGVAIPFDAVRIIPTNNADAKCTADVEVSADGSSWTTIGNYDGTKITILSNTAGNVRYIKVRITEEKANWWQLAEIQWGSYANGTFTRMAASGSVTTEGKTETQVTIKGIKVDTTTIEIDGKTYTIKVVDATLAEQVLPINLWITNTGVVPTGWGTSYNSVTREGFTYALDTAHTSGGWETFRAIYELKATEGSIHSAQGAKLSELIPNTGTAYGYRGGNTPEEYNVDIWKCSYNTPEERQSTDGWTNSSNKGTEFEYIRYWENKWEYYSATTGKWIEISEVGAGKDDSGKNQVCVWYRQVTTVTSEVTTEIVDWGPIKYAANKCLLDFAVKYDGTANRIPNSFPVTGKTIGFDIAPTGNETYYGTDNGVSYRTVYGIAGVETAEYEVYMITLTPSANEPSSSISDYNKYEYKGTEKIAWAKTEADANSAELYKMSNVKYGGEPFLESVKIYQKQGLLVTYYLRAKQTPDSLTVHYAIQGSETAFYEYNIAVNRGTTFNSEIALDPNQDPNVGGPLLYGKVTNSNNETITVSSELATLQGLEPQYRYSKYEIVDFRKDDKNVWIYYTFTREHTYVIDFGLPLKIKFSDFGVTTDAAIDTVSLWEKEIVLENKGLYGTAKVITGSTEGKYVLYTLDKPLDQNITIPLYVKFKQRVDNDNNKPQRFTANIIPATNVYYEDSFAKFTNGSYNGGAIAWEDAGTKPQETPTQALEALGNKTYVYGYDPKYDSCTMFSMGSARKVNVTSDMAKDGVVWPTAQFTFKGTGFDIISLTDNTSGAIFVDVYKGKEATGNRFKSYMVDNYYGYKYENGAWVVDKNASNALYQIPVMRMRDLGGYGEYTAVVTVFYDRAFDHADRKSYNFWLDAVRVYDPMGESVNTGNTYGQDGEAYPQYIKLRSELKELNKGETASSGALFIDGKGNANISEYSNYGPNNEVYLANGQAITFMLTGNDLSKIATVQIGAKSPNSNGTKNANMVIGNITQNLNTATEMYYDITTAAVKNGNAELVTITNTGEAILSLTNLKITYTDGNQTVSLGEVRAEQQTQAVQVVRALFAPAPVEPEPEPEPEKTFEPERFEASWSRNVMQGRKATLTVKTSEDVEAITVDGQTIRSYRTRTERVGFGRRAKRITYREFTYSMVAQESADFSVTAINAEGTESEAITARLTVKTRPNSMRDMWDWFKGWF